MLQSAKYLGAKMTAQQPYTLLILLRPHSIHEIYPVMASMISNRFLSHPVFRARLLRNHMSLLLQYTDFHNCDFTVATNIFRQCLAYNTSPGVAVATYIMRMRPGMYSFNTSILTRLANPQKETENDPPPPIDDPMPSTRRRGLFSAEDLCLLLITTAAVQPTAIMDSLSAYGPSPIHHFPIDGHEQHLADAIAQALLHHTYASLTHSRPTFQCLNIMFYSDVPPLIVRALNDHQDHPSYILAIETVMLHLNNHRNFYDNPIITQSLPDTLDFYRVRYGPDDTVIEDPRRIARILQHDLPYQRHNRWTCAQMQS